MRLDIILDACTPVARIRATFSPRPPNCEREAVLTPTLYEKERSDMTKSRKNPAKDPQPGISR